MSSNNSHTTQSVQYTFQSVIHWLHGNLSCDLIDLVYQIQIPLHYSLIITTVSNYFFDHVQLKRNVWVHLGIESVVVKNFTYWLSISSKCFERRIDSLLCSFYHHIVASKNDLSIPTYFSLAGQSAISLALSKKGLALIQGCFTTFQKNDFQSVNTLAFLALIVYGHVHSCTYTAYGRSVYTFQLVGLIFTLIDLLKCHSFTGASCFAIRCA